MSDHTGTCYVIPCINRMGKKTNLTEKQLNSLAASFYPAIRAYFESEQGKAEYQKYLDEKAGNVKPADENADDKNSDVA